MSEEWRAVTGYEGLYEVSDLGRVRSLDRYVQRNGGCASGRPMRLKGIILKPRPMKSGHLQVNLGKNGISRNELIHQLVLIAFVGPRPKGMEGCHEDGDPSNNNLDNLRWDTRSGNNLDKVRHGNCHQTNKTHCPNQHILAAPNLVACQERRGFRNCLACNRARASARKMTQKGIEVDFVALADEKYKAIMVE